MLEFILNDYSGNLAVMDHLLILRPNHGTHLVGQPCRMIDRGGIELGTGRIDQVSSVPLAKITDTLALMASGKNSQDLRSHLQSKYNLHPSAHIDTILITWCSRNMEAARVLLDMRWENLSSQKQTA
jgi:hypothetical protein